MPLDISQSLAAMETNEHFKVSHMNSFFSGEERLGALCCCIANDRAFSNLQVKILQDFFKAEVTCMSTKLLQNTIELETTAPATEKLTKLSFS